jgi:hypothetical protein
MKGFIRVIHSKNVVVDNFKHKLWICGKLRDKPVENKKESTD